MSNGSMVRLAALSGAVAVAAGAFGAHAATGKHAEWLRTGGEYQMIHAAAALLAARASKSGLSPALLLGGSALFAGTLYAMALGGPRWLGAITPLGGAGMIAGWVALAATARNGG